MNDQQVDQAKQRREEKLHISFTNYALLPASSIPPAAAPPVDVGMGVAAPTWVIQLNDHLFPYDGCESIDRSKFVWGIFGTMSQGESLFMAGRQAEGDNAHSLVVHGNFRLNGPGFSSPGADQESVRKSGFLHLERLEKRFCTTLKEAVLLAAAKRYSCFDPEACGRLTLVEIIAAYPALVMDIFDMESNIATVVHKVRPFWNPWRTLLVCTMRRDPSRIDNLGVRFMPQIQVNL